MYSWGDDTSTWRNPGGYRYDAARLDAMSQDIRAAQQQGPRTYATRSLPDLRWTAPRGKTLYSESANPVLVAVDVTGSMASWPGEIFDRLPLLYQTLSQYRPDLEISFAAIGDAYSDQFPLQVCPFGRGPALEASLKALCPEGGGGGQGRETYELFAYFALRRCQTPHAQRPFLIIFGDERFYDEVDPEHVRTLIGEELPAPVDAWTVWPKLLDRFEVYHLRKAYGGGEDRPIRAQWQKALGAQRVALIHDPLRAVDYAMGIIARAWNRFDDFRANLAARQAPEEVDRVVGALPGG